ncbi:unnamed protein product [Calypogeia fissa]
MTREHSVFYNIFEIFCMGEHFALCDAVRVRLCKSQNRCLYPSPAKDDVVVPVLTGEEHKSKVEAWTRSYFSWAMQERLSDDQALMVALEHLEGKAHAWGRPFSTGASLEDFLYALCKEFKAFSGGFDKDDVHSPRAEKVVPQIKHAFAQMQEITCVRFSYRELAYATNIFSSNNLIKENDIGWLYQGRLPGKRPVAVRRLKKPVCCTETTIEQLQREAKTLSLINHHNLSRLLGCCLEPDEPLLVFEFEPMGNLAQHLQREKGRGLDWETRFTIALETADGLSHLHHACTPPLFHRNLKSSNILLDEDLRPKIAGFGISKSMFTKNFTPLPESKIGYIDPSYAQTYRFTEKSDVYSLGVILMELVSGKKVVDFSRPAGEITLAALAFTKKKLGYTAFKELFDPQLKNLGKTCLSAVHEVALLAIKCMALDLDARPTMKEVSDQLRMIQDREVIRTKRGDTEFME